jgi:aminoglycoside phosphotransferase family enzyme
LPDGAKQIPTRTDQTEKYMGQTSSGGLLRVAEDGRLLQGGGGIIHRRIASHRIRDCHGTFAWNISSGQDNIAIIGGRINERRYTDVAADIGYRNGPGLPRKKTVEHLIEEAGAVGG